MMPEASTPNLYCKQPSFRSTTKRASLRSTWSLKLLSSPTLSSTKITSLPSSDHTTMSGLSAVHYMCCGNCAGSSSSLLGGKSIIGPSNILINEEVILGKGCPLPVISHHLLQSPYPLKQFPKLTTSFWLFGQTLPASSRF